jgi:hypothetical protein
VRAEPAEPVPELESEPDVELVEPVVDESPAHDEPDPASVLVPGVVSVGVVVVLVVVVGSVLVVVVVVDVEVVSVLSSGDEDGVVELAGVVAVLLVAGHVVVVAAGVPVVVAAGVLEPASTVESVWVWVRPASTVGVGLVFESLVATAVPFLAVVLVACGLCVVAAAFFATGLW